MIDAILSALNDFDGLMECVILMVMLSGIFDKRFDKRNCFFVGFCSWLLYVVLNTLVILGSEVWGLFGNAVRFVGFAVIIVLAGFVYACICLNGNKRQFLTTILFYKATVLFLSVLYKSYEGVWEKLLGSTVVEEVLLHLLGLLLMLLSAYLCWRISRPITTKLSEGYWMTAILMPVCLIVIWTMCGGPMGGEDLSSLVFNLLMLLVTFLGYSLFVRLAIEMEKQRELSLNNQSLDLQIRQMNEAEKMLKQARKERHELKNNYMVLESLLKQENYSEMQAVFDQVVWPEFDRYEMVSTGNRLVDLILSQKLTEARMKNVPIVLDVLVSEKIQIRKQILCSLISNLLDNAIEASAKVEEPDIVFSMHELKGYLSIEVRNKIDGSVLKKNPLLKTTKSDKDAHGIGMNIIRQLTEYCDGSLEIKEEDGSFVVSLLLPDCAA